MCIFIKRICHVIFNSNTVQLKCVSIQFVGTHHSGKLLIRRVAFKESVIESTKTTRKYIICITGFNLVLSLSLDWFYQYAVILSSGIFYFYFSSISCSCYFIRRYSFLCIFQSKSTQQAIKFLNSNCISDLYAFSFAKAEDHLVSIQSVNVTTFW